MSAERCTRDRNRSSDDASASRAAISSLTSLAISDTPTTLPRESNSGEIVTTRWMVRPSLWRRVVSTLSTAVPCAAATIICSVSTRRSSGTIAATWAPTTSRAVKP